MHTHAFLGHEAIVGHQFQPSCYHACACATVHPYAAVAACAYTCIFPGLGFIYNEKFKPSTHVLALIADAYLT